MQGEETKAAIIKRILSRLPPSNQTRNVEALKAVVGEEEFTHTSFDFQEIDCSTTSSKFIATPYTQSENHEGAFR